MYQQGQIRKAWGFNNLHTATEMYRGFWIILKRYNPRTNYGYMHASMLTKYMPNWQDEI
jgi:hypothetical protein